MRRLGGESGFTMVEMITTMTILAILSVFSVKPMGKYVAKARQAEAKTTLGHISTLQAVYAIDKQQYDTIAAYGAAGAGTCTVQCGGSACANQTACTGATPAGVWTSNNTCDTGKMGLQLQGCMQLRYNYVIQGGSQGYYATATVDGKDIIFGCEIGTGSPLTIAAYAAGVSGKGTRAKPLPSAFAAKFDSHYVTEEEGLTAAFDVPSNCD